MAGRSPQEEQSSNTAPALTPPDNSPQPPCATDPRTGQPYRFKSGDRTAVQFPNRCERKDRRKTESAGSVAACWTPDTRSRRTTRRPRRLTTAARRYWRQQAAGRPDSDDGGRRYSNLSMRSGGAGRTGTERGLRALFHRSPFYDHWIGRAVGGESERAASLAAGVPTGPRQRVSRQRKAALVGGTDRGVGAEGRPTNARDRFFEGVLAAHRGAALRNGSRRPPMSTTRPNTRGSAEVKEGAARHRHSRLHERFAAPRPFVSKFLSCASCYSEMFFSRLADSAAHRNNTLSRQILLLPPGLLRPWLGI